MKIIHDASKTQDRFLYNYRQLIKAKTDYVVMIGSGGSAKSYSAGQFFTKKLSQKKKRLCVLRKVGADIKDSVLSVFVDDALPFWKFKENVHYIKRKPDGKNEITFTFNGSNILFRGVDDPERFKGINGVDYLWIEEASEFTEEEFNIITDRIRGENVQIFVSMNPISEDHWAKKRFVDSPPLNEDGSSRVTFIHSTYLQNPFVGSKFRLDMEWYKKYDYEHYRIYGLGEWGVLQAKNPFIRNLNYNTMLGKVEYDPRHEVYISMDFNINWTASIKQRIPVGNGKYHRKYIEFLHDDPGELIKTIIDKYGKSFLYFTGDFYGNSNNQYTSDNNSKTAWLILKKYLDSYAENSKGILNYCDKFVDFSAIPTGGNIGHNNSRIVIRALLAVWGADDLVTIDPVGCKEFISDAKTIEATPTGQLDKTKLNASNRGHWLDCFVGDTLIQTNKGQVPIKDIKIGDMVLTRNGYKKVIDSWCNGERIVKDYIVGGVKISCTPDHKFFTKNRGFIRVDSLTHLDTICKIDKNNQSQTQLVQKIESQHKRKEKVYDITVDGEHEFFANGILVHNCFRYDISYFEYEDFKNLGLYDKQLKQSA